MPQNSMNYVVVEMVKKSDLESDVNTTKIIRGLFGGIIVKEKHNDAIPMVVLVENDKEISVLSMKYYNVIYVVIGRENVLEHIFFRKTDIDQSVALGELADIVGNLAEENKVVPTNPDLIITHFYNTQFMPNMCDLDDTKKEISIESIKSIGNNNTSKQPINPTTGNALICSTQRPHVTTYNYWQKEVTFHDRSELPDASKLRKLKKAVVAANFVSSKLEQLQKESDDSGVQGATRSSFGYPPGGQYGGNWQEDNM